MSESSGLSPLDTSAHNVIAMPDGNTIGLPKSWGDDLTDKVAGEYHRLTNQAGQAVGAFSESFGGPSTLDEAKQAVHNAPSDMINLDKWKQAAKQTGQALLQPSDPALLDSAKAAWQAGDKTAAATHFMNFMLPIVGSGSDRTGEDLKHGDYGKAVGHVSAAILPFLFGPEETPVTSEAEAAANAARVSQPVNRIPTFPEKPALENTPLNGRRGPLPNLRPIEYVENAEPVVPKSEAEIAAANFIRKQRLDFNPAGRVLETNGLSDEETGVANISGRTAVTHATETPATATDADVLAYIRKSFPKTDADRLAAKLELVDQEAAAPRLSPEDEAALAHATLARFAANSKDVDAVSQLAQIKQRLGLKDTKELSAEAQATAGAPKSAADVNAFADSAKKRLAVPPKAQVQSVDYGEDTFGAGAREHRLMSGDKKMGSMVTAPLSQTEMEIKSAHIEKSFRSQGHSLPLYEQGFADAKAQGYDTVRSDRVDVSPEAMRTWESLLARNPDAVQKFNDPASGRVAYRVNLDKYKAGASKKVPSVPVPSKASATPASGPSFLERANEAASKALNKHTEYDLTDDWRDAITGDSTK